MESESDIVSPATMLEHAFTRLEESRGHMAPVVDSRRLAGLVNLENVSKFLAVQNAPDSTGGICLGSNSTPKPGGLSVVCQRSSGSGRSPGAGWRVWITSLSHVCAVFHHPLERMRMSLKRTVISVLGWAFILLGIAGLFLPILQGVLFLLAGLVILSSEYAWALLLLERLKARFPRVGQWIAKASAQAELWKRRILLGEDAP